MKRSLLRRSLVAATALSAGVATLLGGAPPAHATTTGVVVTAGGSDTSENIMKALLDHNAGGIYDGSSVTIGSTPGVIAHTYSIPAFSSSSYTVPGEQGNNDCPNDVVWNKDPLAPGGTTTATLGVAPFGSTAGRNYLAAEDGSTGPGASGSATQVGCLDVARSSGAPRASGAGDKSTFEYYAFGFDAVTWATTSTKAPAVLTRAQLTSIYQCGTTDWGAVGGAPGQIQRYIPQPGSGTRSFFLSDILTSSTAPENFSGANCPAVVQKEENQAGGTYSGGTRTGGVNAADYDRNIQPYSVALWDYQASNGINPTLDRRCPAPSTCARLGLIQTTAASSNIHADNFWNAGNNDYELDPAIVTDNNVKQFNSSWSESGGNQPGIRYIYNVLDNVQNRAGYQAAFQLLGFQNAGGGFKSPLCTAGGDQGIISSFGFLSLPTTTSPANLAGSACRFYAGVS